ncbi:PREDICTED: membrane-bound transcription factor site-2 protease-like [Acropora digitifera]|uniref:membrane-bound transcription factor site-2 protease-like n=1 Tax=Acropora digitifera TaxID=70779 RepID=UPI00077A456A|nr:PREDICTED: membrane-bound transcription factor site-2 protease-like [Acropora digitifera]
MSSIILILGFWTFVFICNALLKNYRKYSIRYRDFLENNGVTLSICQVRWYTTRFNRSFVKFVQVQPYMLHLWFSFGVFVGALLMISSVVILCLTLYKAFTQNAPDQVLTPVMPGVNVPWSQVLYYLITLTISGIFHEFGHAISAVREQVRVNGFGMFFMLIYPGAFVDLYTEHLTVISPLRQLRIFCAGVWHNAVLVLVGLLLLCSLPFLLAPFYVTGQGAVVFSVLKESPLYGSIEPGDTILSLYGCQVYNKQDWYHCISKTLSAPQHGYCSDLLTITRKNSSQGGFYSRGVYHCCKNSTSSRFCFKYVSLSHSKGFACLPARSTMQSRKFCNLPTDCDGPGDKVCVHPSLDNSSRLMKIIRSTGSDVLYVGDPLLLQYTVGVIDYQRRSVLLPMEFPNVLETFLIYLVSLSGALALLNMVPCYALDGQWALFAFVDHTLTSYICQEDQRNMLCNVILTLGTLLLASNIMLALWTLGSV